MADFEPLSLLLLQTSVVIAFLSILEILIYSTLVKAIDLSPSEAKTESLRKLFLVCFARGLLQRYFGHLTYYAVH